MQQRRLQLYGLYQGDRHYFASGASVGISTFSGQRKIIAPQRIAVSDYRGVNAGAYTVLGYYWKQVGNWTLIPTWDVNFNWNRVNGHVERGAGSLNLIQRASVHRTIESGIGIKFSGRYDFKHVKFNPFIKMGVHHEFLGESSTSRLAYTGAEATGFTSVSPSPVRDRLNAGLGFDLISNSGLSISAGYDFNVREKYTSHTGSLKVRWEF